MLPLVHERGFELLLEKILSQPTVRPFVTKRVRTPPATSLGKGVRNHLAHWFLTPFPPQHLTDLIQDRRSVDQHWIPLLVGLVGRPRILVSTAQTFSANRNDVLKKTFAPKTLDSLLHRFDCNVSKNDHPWISNESSPVFCTHLQILL